MPLCWGACLSWRLLCAMSSYHPPSTPHLLAPTLCEGWACASFPKVISLKSALVGVFTPWKWANMTHQGFFFSFLFSFEESVTAMDQCMAGCVSACPCLPGFLCRVQLQLSRVVTYLMVCLPLPALPHLSHFLYHVSFSSQINALAFLSRGLFLA